MSPLLRRGALAALFAACWWAPYVLPFRGTHSTVAAGARPVVVEPPGLTKPSLPVEAGWYLALGLSTLCLFSLIWVLSRELPLFERRFEQRPALPWLCSAVAGTLLWLLDRALWPEVCVFCAHLNTLSAVVKVHDNLLVQSGTALLVPPLGVAAARVFGHRLESSKLPFSVWLVAIAGVLFVTPPYLVLAKGGQFALFALGAVAFWLREVPGLEARSALGKWRARASMLALGAAPAIPARPLVDHWLAVRGAGAVPILNVYAAVLGLAGSLAFVVVCLSSADALAWALRGARSLRTRLLVFGLCSAALAFVLADIQVPVHVMGEGAALGEVVSLLVKLVGAATIVFSFALVLSRGEADFLERLNADLRGRSEALARALETLRETQVELVRSERMASVAVLVKGIAHELNNPINYIAGNIGPLRRYSSFLARVALDLADGRARSAAELEALTALAPRKDLAFVVADLERLTEDLGEGARRAALIIGDLQQLTSVSRRGIELVDLARTVRQTVTLIAPRTPAGVELEVSVSDVPPLPARAGELEQMLLNLVDNAVHAVGARGRVKIELLALEGELELSVADDGPGMPEDVRLRVFEPFFTTRAAGEGSGLGLAIVASIVRAHRGVVEVSSEPGHGARFTVRLPLEQGGSLEKDAARTSDAPRPGDGK
jgi:signal transduction histidine kinase